jgi:putative addiction module component (TIGR02574 family)
MTTYSEILQAALTLPPGERSDLAVVLWDSIDEEPADGEGTPELSAAWRAEIARRSAAYVRGELQSIPWQAARDEVLRKHRNNA